MTTRQNLDIQQGADWSHTHTVLDASGDAVDLTGYSARMAVKTGYSGGNVAYLSDGSDANGGTLTLGGIAGTVVMSMTASQTAALPWCVGLSMGSDARIVEFIYDLELIDGADMVTRELEGRFILHLEVTT